MSAAGCFLGSDPALDCISIVLGLLNGANIKALQSIASLEPPSPQVPQPGSGGVISILPSDNYAISMPFNGPGSAASSIGQTFIVPNATAVVLTRVSFFVEDEFPFCSPNCDSVTGLRAFIYQWSGLQPVGPPLFASPALTLSAEVGGGSYQRIDFPTTGVTLSLGVSYIAFLSGIGDGYRSFAAVYAGAGVDLAFEADFAGSTSPVSSVVRPVQPTRNDLASSLLTSPSLEERTRLVRNPRSKGDSLGHEARGFGTRSQNER